MRAGVRGVGARCPPARSPRLPQPPLLLTPPCPMQAAAARTRIWVITMSCEAAAAAAAAPPSPSQPHHPTHALARAPPPRRWPLLLSPLSPSPPSRPFFTARAHTVPPRYLPLLPALFPAAAPPPPPSLPVRSLVPLATDAPPAPPTLRGGGGGGVTTPRKAAADAAARSVRGGGGCAWYSWQLWRQALLGPGRPSAQSPLARCLQGPAHAVKQPAGAGSARVPPAARRVVGARASGRRACARGASYTARCVGISRSGRATAVLQAGRARIWMHGMSWGRAWPPRSHARISLPRAQECGMMRGATLILLLACFAGSRHGAGGRACARTSACGGVCVHPPSNTHTPSDLTQPPPGTNPAAWAQRPRLRPPPPPRRRHQSLPRQPRRTRLPPSCRPPRQRQQQQQSQSPLPHLCLRLPGMALPGARRPSAPKHSSTFSAMSTASLTFHTPPSAWSASTPPPCARWPCPMSVWASAW